MKVICLLNEKGGTGKTSTAVALATLFAQAGYRALLADLDSQGHATIATRLPREDRLYLMIKQGGSLKQVLQPAPVEFTGGDPVHPLLWVVASAEGTARLNDKDENNQYVDPYTLKLRLAELERVFDVVIMDTSPQIGHLHLMALLASDWLIYPSAMLYYSIQGLYASFQHLQNIQNKRDEMGQPEYRVGRVMGILPTMYNSRKKVQKDSLNKLKAQYSDALFFSPLKFLTAWDEAAQLRLPINRLGYDNDAAPEAERFAREVLQRLGVVENA